jgi:hypothetical protein
MNRYFRNFLLLVCAVQLFFAVAFVTRLPFVVRLWPLPYTNQTSFIFIASIFAAAAASTLWCIVTREYRALIGVALDYGVILTPTAIFSFQTASGSRASALIGFGVACMIGVIFGLGLLLWARRFPVGDAKPVPRLVYGSFAVFVIALIIAGGSLVLKTPRILPWQVTAPASVFYGWFFLGAAAYFAYGLLRPGWYNAGGQLAGFLVYDLVLIVPFLGLLPTISPALRPNLIIYTLVVSFSGLLAIYYLFFNSSTRLWRGPRLIEIAT